MIADFFTLLISIIIDIFTKILDAIFSIFNLSDIPVINNAAEILTSMWDFAFDIIGYVRSALLLDTFEMSIIIDIIAIRLLYKPVISVVKMFVGWFNKLKV